MDGDDKEYANLPKKLRENGKLDILEIELCTEAFAATHQWEMMKREV